MEVGQRSSFHAKAEAGQDRTAVPLRMASSGFSRDTAAGMSEENVATLRRLFEPFQAALARNDPGAWFDSEALADEAEWIMFPGFPGPQSYRGRDAFVEFMRTWTEDFEDWSIELERLIDAGDDRVVALFRQTATGKASGGAAEV